MSLKSRARKILPAPVFNALLGTGRAIRRQADFLRLCQDSLVDARRYFRWSHTGRGDSTASQHGFALLKAYHGVEKGLSLAEPRPGFGGPKVRDVADKVDHLHRREGGGAISDAATASLIAYRAFNESRDISQPWLDAWLDRMPAVEPSSGGTTTLHRRDIEAAVAGVTPEFFTSRHSIRNFAPGEVPVAAIEAAVRLAQKAPSVCNRQGGKVYCFTDAMQALRHQKGNAGFGHLASRGLVVTADIQAFSSVGERHQAYVDGGLFAMSLVYALHSMGYGCCMLAWSSRAAEEARLRRELDIPDSEAVIMMIAVGCLPDSLQVARAWRRPLDEVLVIR